MHDLSQAGHRGWWDCYLIQMNRWSHVIGKLESGEYLSALRQRSIDRFGYMGMVGIVCRLLHGRRLVFMRAGVGVEIAACPGAGRRIHYLHPGIANPFAIFSRPRSLRFFSLRWKRFPSGFF